MRYVIKINRFGIDEIVGVYNSEIRAYRRFKSLRLFYGNGIKLKVELEKYL